MRLHLHIVNEELARLGLAARLNKGKGYFYFEGGETETWVDCGVPVRKISEFTLKEWISEFFRLKDMNEQILGTLRKKP